MDFATWKRSDQAKGLWPNTIYSVGCIQETPVFKISAAQGVKTLVTAATLRAKRQYLTHSDAAHSAARRGEGTFQDKKLKIPLNVL